MNAYETKLSSGMRRFQVPDERGKRGDLQRADSVFIKELYSGFIGIQPFELTGLVDRKPLAFFVPISRFANYAHDGPPCALCFPKTRFGQIGLSQSRPD